MNAIIEKYLSNNQLWAKQKRESNPDYFDLLAKEQHPNALILGCSDSRVSPSVVIGAELGEVFVHRNIANVVSHADLNFLSVLQYAIEVLQIRHIIIYGHYGCGGIKAAMSNKHYGLIDNWLANIRDVIEWHQQELQAIDDEHERFNRLVELNVLAQMKNLRQSSVYRKAAQNGCAPQLHAWVYDFSTGIIRDLQSSPEIIIPK
ncbi:MAG TPA: carbonic anhydrase [Saprospiraceae bacterium]|nr:carbonic anhydrase [Saprospiraceae bacterium]HMP13834.1 carbonic anhydrase [Saprospiraceae bacterium]